MQEVTHRRENGYPKRRSAEGQVDWHRLFLLSINKFSEHPKLQVLFLVDPKYPLGHFATQVIEVESEKNPVGQMNRQEP